MGYLPWNPELALAVSEDSWQWGAKLGDMTNTNGESNEDWDFPCNQNLFQEIDCSVSVWPTAAVFAPQKRIVHLTNSLFTMTSPQWKGYSGVCPMLRQIHMSGGQPNCWCYIPISFWFIKSPNQVRICCWFINVYNTHNVVHPI